MDDAWYGVDVAAARADDVDKMLLESVMAAVVQKQQPTVLDIGCGSGGQAARTAVAGAHVTAVDITDYQQAIESRNLLLPEGVPAISFVQAPLQTHITELESTYQFVLLQRVLHYVPYAEAYRALQLLRSCTRDRLYASVTGSESAIGLLHPERTQPIEARFTVLPEAVANTFSIHAPLVVYKAVEITALLEATGWAVEKQWQSAFGNHKIIATPRR